MQYMRWQRCPSFVAYHCAVCYDGKRVVHVKIYTFGCLCERIASISLGLESGGKVEESRSTTAARQSWKNVCVCGGGVFYSFYPEGNTSSRRMKWLLPFSKKDLLCLCSAGKVNLYGMHQSGAEAELGKGRPAQLHIIVPPFSTPLPHSHSTAPYDS